VLNPFHWPSELPPGKNRLDCKSGCAIFGRKNPVKLPLTYNVDTVMHVCLRPDELCFGVASSAQIQASAVPEDPKIRKQCEVTNGI
jgi:hypothetical protein